MTALGPRQLSFVCELDSERLTQLFSDGSVTDDLRALAARVMIMVSDLTQERAAVIGQVNDAGIPLWMLYTSFLRTFGPGLLWSYGPEADAIAVGSTGGGPDIEGHPQVPALSWDEFARDLRLAHRFTN